MVDGRVGRDGTCVPQAPACFTHVFVDHGTTDWLIIGNSNIRRQRPVMQDSRGGPRSSRITVTPLDHRWGHLDGPPTGTGRRETSHDQRARRGRPMRPAHAIARRPHAPSLTGYTPGVTDGSTPPDLAGTGPAGSGRAQAPTAQSTSTRPRRPTVVTILAVLQLLTAAAYGMILAALIATGPAALALLIGDAAADGPLGDVEVATLVVGVGGFAVATLAAGILLLRMRQLGWTITMLLAGIGLVSSISLWWTQGTTIAIGLLVQVMTVFYLNQRQVREAFGISRREAGDALSAAGTTRDGAGATPGEARG